MHSTQRHVAIFSLSATLALCATASGCALDTDKSEPQVAATHEALTGAASLSAVAVGATVDLTLNVSSGSQGFLSAVKGNLGQTSSQVAAYVFDSLAGPIFHVRAAPLNGANTLAASGWAVYPGNNTLPLTGCIHSGAGTVQVPLPTPPSGPFRCFLTLVNNQNGPDWGSFSDNAHVVYGPTGAPSLSCTGNVSAQAMCMPITTYLGGASASSGNSVDLGVAQAGEVCMLTGVGGVFRTNTSTVGVSVGIDGANHRRLQTAANEGAYADCIK